MTNDGVTSDVASPIGQGDGTFMIFARKTNLKISPNRDCASSSPSTDRETLFSDPFFRKPESHQGQLHV